MQPEGLTPFHQVEKHILDKSKTTHFQTIFQKIILFSFSEIVMGIVNENKWGQGIERKRGKTKTRERRGVSKKKKKNDCEREMDVVAYRYSGGIGEGGVKENIKDAFCFRVCDRCLWMGFSVFVNGNVKKNACVKRKETKGTYRNNKESKTKEGIRI